MRQPVVLATVNPAIIAKRILRIEAILRDFARAPRILLRRFEPTDLVPVISDCPLGSEDKIRAALAEQSD